MNNKLITGADLSLAMFYMAQIKYEKNDLNSANSFALKSYKKLK